MSPRTFSRAASHDVEPLRSVDTIETAVRRLLDAGLPALPVVGEDDRFAGIFGEREFMSALFPGYLSELKGAAFLSHSIDAAIQRRETCRDETVGRYMNTEHVDVGSDYADVQLAEIFLHHRVLVVPVVDNGRVRGVVTRQDFFRAIAAAFTGE